MIRQCPKCGTKRPIDEFVCQGRFHDQVCGWDLTTVPLRHAASETGSDSAVLPPTRSSPALICRNGHPVGEGDLLCPICSADVVPAIEAPPQEDAGDGLTDDDGGTLEPTLPAGWQVVRPLRGAEKILTRTLVRHSESGREAVHAAYKLGMEPDPEVFAVLQRIDLDHVPEIYDYGHEGGAAYSISELISGGSLAELDVDPGDIDTLRTIVDEIGRALADLHAVGLRHRALRPDAILIRDRDTLDLVIDDFSSARMSEFDLDVVAPLETTRYMAPEAIAGGVAAASDWWSLGMVLLDKLTQGRCFEGVNEQAFLIHIVAGGISMPAGLSPEVESLLYGLLTRDRTQRWAWPELRRWLDGEQVPFVGGHDVADAGTGPAILLEGTAYYSAPRFALAAAQGEGWDSAIELLRNGQILTWASEIGISAAKLAALRSLATRELEPDLHLGVALKILNPDMPLIQRGEIVSPAWLLANPETGYALVTGNAPDILADMDSEPWLVRLKSRAEAVRKRAAIHRIDLNEEKFRVFTLSTSVARLHELWNEHRAQYPDSNHHDLAAISDRSALTEEDLILLLSTDVDLYTPVADIVEQASDLARRARLDDFDSNAALGLVRQHSRRALHALIGERTENFARCGNETIDPWVDEYRLERRTSLARALVILAVPSAQWQVPAQQVYLARILEFFEQKVSFSIRRGPLTRMSVSPTGHRIDITEIGSPLNTAESLLRETLRRSERAIKLDPQPFTDDPLLESRLRNLVQRTSLFRRDTGIESLYLGFPFVVAQPSDKAIRTRIAPLLLWPIKIKAAAGIRSSFELSFDVEREEVRLNPALESIVGSDQAERWSLAAERILQTSATPETVIAEFAQFADGSDETLDHLPGLDTRLPAGKIKIVSSAVLFHAEFAGQAIVEDLAGLRTQQPEGTALEALLRMSSERTQTQDAASVSEIDRYFTVASDPSQENAVLRARVNPGIAIEGPPGTGKSQTIVNIVGDAIGRKKSVLVVCQKQAALDVVRKRLEREGLNDRLVHITDINRDRRSTIQMVREQVEELRRKTNPISGLNTERARCASRIDAIEDELDAYHRALHAKDELSGLSYRDLIAELAELDSHRKTTADALKLRGVVGQMTPEQLAIVEERCAPLAHLWLASDYETTPLKVVKEFGWDAATITEFARSFRTFADAEARRSVVMRDHPSTLFLSERAPASRWLAHGVNRLRNMRDDVFIDLCRWFAHLDPQRANESGATPARERIAKLTSDLEALPHGDHADAIYPLFEGVDDEILLHWISVAERATRIGKWWSGMSRWFARRTLRKVLTKDRMPSRAESLKFLSAARLEANIRPIRQAVGDIARAFGVAPRHSRPLSGSELINELSSLGRRLDEVAPFVAIISDCPARPEALAAIQSGDRDRLSGVITEIDAAVHQCDARLAAIQAFEPFAEAWLKSDFAARTRARLDANEGILPGVLAFGQALPTLIPLQQFRARSRDLPPECWEVFRRLREIDTDLRALEPEGLDREVRTILSREARLAWKARIEHSMPELLFGRDEIAAKIVALGAEDRAMRDLNRRLLADGIDVGRLGSSQHWEDITRLAGPRMRRLREFFSLGADIGLLEVRPVWLMNPDTASRLLPLRRGLFDVVIYDEASQMPVEFALPTLFRGGLAVVSGDEKQLPPTAFFSSKIESDEGEIFDGLEPDPDASEEEIAAAEEAWNRREIKDCPDLLALANATLPRCLLQIHYRSEYRELIGYSNAAFYGGALNVPARHPDAKVRSVKPIEMVRVDGTYHKQTNSAEADRIVQLLRQYWNGGQKARPSIGIVTFNLKQADLISERVQAFAEKDPDFRAALVVEQARADDGEDMSLFIKNVESVQGDERDVIMFSTTFGRNAQGTFRRNFGVLGQKGGERRLNVAVTRARSKVVIATSMPIDDISDAVHEGRAPQIPRDYVQYYLRYAENLSDGDLDAMHTVMQRVSGKRTNDASRRTDGDAFGRTVSAYIRDEIGLDPIPARDGTAFGLDYAIVDPRTGLFGIGIECDAPENGLLASARAREIWRPAVLSRSVPVIHRVSAYGWHHDRQTETGRLREAIADALGQEVAL